MLNRFMTIRVSLNFFKEYKERHLGYVLSTQRRMALKKREADWSPKKKNHSNETAMKIWTKKKTMNEKRTDSKKQNNAIFEQQTIFSQVPQEKYAKKKKKTIKKIKLSWGKLETVKLPMDFLNITNVFIYYLLLLTPTLRLRYLRKNSIKFTAWRVK